MHFQVGCCGGGPGGRGAQESSLAGSRGCLVSSRTQYSSIHKCTNLIEPPVCCCEHKPAPRSGLDSGGHVWGDLCAFDLEAGVDQLPAKPGPPPAPGLPSPAPAACTPSAAQRLRLSLCLVPVGRRPGGCPGGSATQSRGGGRLPCVCAGSTPALEEGGSAVPPPGGGASAGLGQDHRGCGSPWGSGNLLGPAWVAQAPGNSLTEEEVALGARETVAKG